MASIPQINVNGQVKTLATQAGGGHSRKYLLTEGTHDNGNAICVDRLHNHRFAYNEALGWMQFTGSHWSTSGAEAAVDRSIVYTLESRIQEAVSSGQSAQFESLIKSCIPNNSKVRGCKALLQSLVYVGASAFDDNPDLLNCKNGTVDLRSGSLMPHDRKDYLTHCAPVDYVPDADQSVWTEWLFDAIDGCQETLDYLRMAIGYSATGHTSEETLWYLYGPPRAGKGLFCETLLHILGSGISREVNFSTFTAQRSGDSQNFDLAPLRAARFIAASESNSYERFNEAKIKALTGGNEIYCAFKHKNHFNYKPKFKIWLSSNQPVNADPDDDAVWGRLRVIEFPNSHLGKEDKGLKARMRKSSILEGVLAWIVSGAVDWFALGDAGLPEISSSASTKQGQRDGLDNVQAWIDECCKVSSDYTATNSELYKSYRQWCEDGGVTPKKQKSLTQSLVKKGFDNHQGKGFWHTELNKTARGFKGIRVAGILELSS